jgi:hypothetical protein
MAAWAIPTAWVLVIAIGPAKVPDSRIHDTPVISPLPFWEKKPAATGSPAPAAPRGWIAVTPVRTDVPRISVAVPTSTPGTSVIAFHGPGVPPNGIPSDLARGLPDGVAACGPVSPALMSGSGMADILPDVAFRDHCTSSAAVASLRF